MDTYIIKLNFRSVCKLGFVLGFCTGIVWAFVFGIGIILGAFPGDPPPLAIVVFIPFAVSALFGLHIPIGYPAYKLLNKYTKGIRIQSFKSNN
ncbi:MAG: hypothetical protein OEZ39_08445 [Gammaproteobacteria bacterium]|nr:hypothetical protein [Gammaproteobacteria bacterium]MDH5651891.1 hypothetical protein [Gammaproteobacteria bacterium]